MSLQEAHDRIQNLKKRYLLSRSLEIVLYSVATFLLMFAITGLFTAQQEWKIGIAVVMGLIIVAERIIHYKLLSLNDSAFIQFLNQQYPQLEESADLFLKSETTLNILQQLQLQKTLIKFNSLYPEIKLPNSIVQSAIVFIVGVVFYFGLTAFVPKPIVGKDSVLASPLENIKGNAEPTIAIINKLVIQIEPPEYTSTKPTKADNPNITIPEGSRVTWTAAFSSAVKSASIYISGKDSLVMKMSDSLTFSTRMEITESGFYQVQWKDQDKVISSDYYKIEVVKDQVPKLSIDNLNQFTQLSFSDKLSVNVKSTLRDDYGLSDASIIATVSKGSGESVKFREERLRFDSPTKISGKDIEGEITLNLNKLGLEPGDELYFYVESFDNKVPIHNYNRTETFFIALQDTTTTTYVEDEGLGVDLMPEYFRSQRQIIIDSEKLLKDRKKMSKQEFNSGSNELGYDQKVLRLRYGQFLGEEFEGAIGKVEVDDHEEESTESIIDKFGHAHDKENEHNLVADKKAAPVAHDHDGGKDPNAKADPLEAFAHNHDDGEVATFFVQSVRAKLKAALTVMWDAELHLRLFDPEKSLPYQYTALKLLKEISNDSRIYVHRTGFDPPPLKEEKRLSGDLSEVNSATAKYNQKETENFPAIRQAINLVEEMIGTQRTLSSASERQLFQKAGQELAKVALEQPGNYLEGLSLLKLLADGTGNEAERKSVLLQVRKILWRVLPQESISPEKKSVLMHKLDEQFLQNLESTRND
jgi:bifunctional DNA-binding transcriptional regulator/antitoxin component of YhaV-PrlF toxin-antitoxin module